MNSFDRMQDRVVKAIFFSWNRLWRFFCGLPDSSTRFSQSQKLFEEIFVRSFFLSRNRWPRRILFHIDRKRTAQIEDLLHTLTLLDRSEDKDM